MARLPEDRFWRGKRVWLSGITGFKGSWLAFWLARMGAHVDGFALPPETSPSAFAALQIADRARWQVGDVRDADAVRNALAAAEPEFVFHLAAQPLVLRAHREPVETFDTNVMGTVHVLEAVRRISCVRAVVVVTTDKVYAEDRAGRPYRESDALGGPEPYAASKACAEIVTAAYRDAFLRNRGIPVATVRAGNVIGGGDWSVERLIPDIVRALSSGQPLAIRHPKATRPWQHVLDPLTGYLILAEQLAQGAAELAASWNIGPDAESFATVQDVVSRFEGVWGRQVVRTAAARTPHEAPQLLLDSSAARAALEWMPRFDLDAAVTYTAEWYRAHADGEDLVGLTSRQLDHYVLRRPLAS